MRQKPTYRLLKRPGPAALNGIITIYRAQGWWRRGDSPAMLRRLISGSYLFAVAELDGRVIGMARAISDGVSDAYIQDVAVLKEFRSAGAGSGLVRALLKGLKSGGIKWVGLIAQDDSHPFYGPLGFSELKRARPMLLKGSYV